MDQRNAIESSPSPSHMQFASDVSSHTSGAFPSGGSNLHTWPGSTVRPFFFRPHYSGACRRMDHAAHSHQDQFTVSQKRRTDPTIDFMQFRTESRFRLFLKLLYPTRPAAIHSQDHQLANPPRRYTDPRAAAEAAFKPFKKPAAPVREPSAAPNAREAVSIRIDRAVLDHFQEGGPGWQDRINDALRQVVAEKKRSDDG